MRTESLQNIPWWVRAIITAVLSVLGTIYTINYTSNKTDKQAIVDRVAIVESRQQKMEAHQQDDHEILVHIQSQSDKLTDKVDRLIENVLGDPAPKGHR